MEARATWKGGYETRLEDDRGHRVVVDLPVHEGGGDVGTSALELTVLSLAGCISTIFTLIAEKRRLPFDALSIALTADRPTDSPTIERVCGTLTVETAAPKEEVEAALCLTMKTCPVGILLERAHVPVEVSAVVVAPSLTRPTEFPYEIPEPEWAL